MAELDRRIAAAEDTHLAIEKALARDGPDAVDRIMALRVRFAEQVVDILDAMRSDSRLLCDPDLAQAFEDRFLGVRRRLAEHQAVWRGADIAKDPAGYHRATRGLAGLQADFYHWAKAALEPRGGRA